MAQLISGVKKTYGSSAASNQQLPVKIEIDTSNSYYPESHSKIFEALADKPKSNEYQLDPMQELRIYLSQLKSYRNKLAENVPSSEQPSRGKQRRQEEEESIAELDRLYREGIEEVVLAGFEEASLDILSSLNGISHMDFCADAQQAISRDIELCSQVCSHSARTSSTRSKPALPAPGQRSKRASGW